MNISGNRVTKIGVLFGLFALLSACASTSKITLEEKQAEIGGYELPVESSDEDALVYIVRPAALGFAVRFKVYLDGKKEDGKYIGYTRGKQYLLVPVSVGDHVVNSKAENWASIEITANEGDVIFVKQIPTLGLVFSRNRLEQIDSIDGKYFMSKYELVEGTYISENGEEIDTNE